MPTPTHADLGSALARCRRRHRRVRRLAALVYVLAGGGFGTCLYLARTRLLTFVRGQKLPVFAGLVALAVLLFLLATRIDADARRADAEAQALEERLAREEAERPRQSP